MQSCRCGRLLQLATAFLLFAVHVVHAGTFFNLITSDLASPQSHSAILAQEQPLNVSLSDRRDRRKKKVPQVNDFLFCSVLLCHRNPFGAKSELLRMAGAAVASPFGGVLQEYTLLAEFKLAQKHAAKGLYLAVNPSGAYASHKRTRRSQVCQAVFFAPTSIADVVLLLRTAWEDPAVAFEHDEGCRCVVVVNGWLGCRVRLQWVWGEKGVTQPMSFIIML